MLDESVLGDEVLKVLHGDKVVVDAVLLAVAGLARRVRHGQREGVGVRREQLVVQRALADARGAGDDEGSAVGGGDCVAMVRFWLV